MKYWIALLVFFFYPLHSISQLDDSSISFNFVTDSIELQSSKVIQTSLQLKNTTATPVRTHIRLQSSGQDVVLSKTIDQIVDLQPFEQLFLPVTAVVNSNSADSKLFIEAHLTHTNRTVITQTLKIIPQKVRNVLMTLSRDIQSFRTLQDSVTFTIAVRNTGNTKEQLHLILKYPRNITSENYETFSFSLNGIKDTIVEHTIPVTESMLKRNSFTVQASLYYTNGDFIKSDVFTVNAIKNSHRYTSEHTDEMRTNQLLFGGRYMSSFNDLSLRTFYNQDIKVSENVQFLVNVNSDYWSKTQQFFLRNSTIGFKNETFDISAGSVYHLGEIALAGRGIHSNFVLNDSMRLHLGVVDKSFEITDNFDYSRGQSGWLDFTSDEKKGKVTRFNFDTDRYSGTNRYILHHNQPLISKNNLKLVYNQGVSVLFGRIDQAPGMLTSIRSFYALDKWQWLGNHTVSTGKYAGMRRGLTFLNQRVNHNWEKHQVSLMYNYYNHNPKAIDKYESLTFNQQNQLLQLRYRYDGSPRFNYSAGPGYVNEKRIVPGLMETVAFKMVKMNLQAQYRGSSNDFLATSLLEFGRVLNTNYSIFHKPFAFKTEVSLQYKGFYLNSSYQYNYSNIHETLMPLEKEKVYYSFMLNLMGNHELWHQNIRLNWGMYYMDNIFFKGLQSNLRVNYRLSNHFEMYVNAFVNETLRNYYTGNYQIEAGLVKKFLPVKLHEKKHHLTIKLIFNENNTDFIPAANRIVYINDQAFVTDEHGEARFLKIPSGIYVIKTVNDDHWMAMEETITVSDNTTHTVFLNKTTTVRGSIQWLRTKNSYNISTNEVSFLITAVDVRGKEFRTYTAANGTYALFLPQDRK